MPSKRILFTAIAGIIIVIFTVGDTGFYKHSQLVRKKKHVKEQINAELQKKELLKQEIDSLENNPEYLERFVREKHQMGDKDEIIFTVED